MMDPMSGLPRFDHVGITVADLDIASAFFVGLGFEVEGRTTLEGLAADGYGVIGGVGEHEHVWRMAAVRGPEGIIVNLAERIGETK
jgi:hypothetical protein